MVLRADDEMSSFTWQGSEMLAKYIRKDEVGLISGFLCRPRASCTDDSQEHALVASVKGGRLAPLGSMLDHHVFRTFVLRINSRSVWSKGSEHYCGRQLRFF